MAHSVDIRSSHGCIGDWWPVQPWMTPAGKAMAYQQAKPPDKVIQSSPRAGAFAAEPSPRLPHSPEKPWTARKNLGAATRPFASEDMRLMASRSDASPVARSPRENWPPREHHHHFGSHNPNAFHEPPTQHATSFSPRSAMAVASNPWSSNTSPPLTGASQSQMVNGDVHGRMVAKARVRTYMATRPKQETSPFMRHQRAWRDDRVGAPGYIGPSLERFDK